MINRRTLFKAIPFLGAILGSKAKSEEEWHCSIPESEPITLQPQYDDPMIGLQFPVRMDFIGPGHAESSFYVTGEIISRKWDGHRTWYTWSAFLPENRQANIIGHKFNYFVATLPHGLGKDESPMPPPTEANPFPRPCIADGESEIIINGYFHIL